MRYQINKKGLDLKQAISTSLAENVVNLARCIALLIFSILFLPSLAYGSAEKPNVIFILADDIGYGSVNAYGAKKQLLRTPHIDQLAEQGMQFMDANTPSSVCSPTRYGFLTGIYPWRSSLKFGVVKPRGPLIIDTSQVTIADMFKSQGYQTAAIGKWHLGYGTKDPVDFTAKLTPGPLDLGFDYHFGVPQNHGDLWGVYVENDEVYRLRSSNIYPFARNFYKQRYAGIDAPQRVDKEVTAELTERAVEWLKSQDSDTPFFLYYAPIAVHRPITPSDQMRGVSDCGAYCDFIQDLDYSVGQLLDAVEYLGLSDNTIIIFTSDNGAQVTLDDKKSPELHAIKKGLNINGNFRGKKHTIWEGGTRVPFIVKWPGRVKPGSISDDMVSIVDVYATLEEIVAQSASGRTTHSIDSYSFLPSLLGTGGEHERPVLITADVDGMLAIRKDNWKYIDDKPPHGLKKRRIKQLEAQFRPQLYNLSADLSEENNVIASHPERAARLKKELEYLRENPSRRGGD